MFLYRSLSGFMQMGNFYHGLQGDFGPFYPQMATQVPMWLAIALKKRGKCTIRPPEWMSVGESCFFSISLIYGSMFATHYSGISRK